MTHHVSLLHTLWTWVQIVLALGGIILVHEFGHFIVAKRCGMQVDEFAIGIGPRIASWERDETHYSVGLLLLLGYVRVRGLEGEESPESLAGGFYSRSRGERLAFLVGGAAANLVCACLLFCLLYTVWGKLDVHHDTTIAAIAPGSAAQAVGVEPGWRIASIDGQAVQTYEQVEKLVRTSGGKPIDLVVTKGAAVRTFRPTPRRKTPHGRFLIGVVFRDDGGNLPLVGRVIPGGPAAEAGLLPGDELTQVDGRPVTHPDEILDALAKVPPALEHKDPKSVRLAPVTLGLVRNGQPLNLVVQPRAQWAKRLKPAAPGEVVDPDADRPVESYLVGSASLVLQRRFVHLGPVTALRTGFESSWTIVTEVITNLIELLGGHGLNRVGGPIVIVKQLGDAASAGLYDLLLWAANLSIMIGVFNLLPLPALDGGRVVFVIVDWCYSLAFSRRELDRRFESWIHAIGLLMLLLLMALVSYRDITR